MNGGGMTGTGIRQRAAQFARAVALAIVAAMSAAAIAGNAFADTPAGAAASRVPKPGVTAPAAGGKCVEDTAFMRRNHMALLKHQRDRTVRDGIRTTQHSLANCVTCHADAKTGRVTGSKDAFCEGCHRYAGVTLDCFECHTDRARPAVTAAAASAGAPR
jgi:hypothetical protein